MQVWSADYGYPGDADYREFYRDVGYDADWDYIRPYIQATGARKNVGIKYYKTTGKAPLDQQQPYKPEAARRKADLHAANFLFNRTKQVEYLRQAFGEGPPPIVISPYDAELYGHWWYEGPAFIDLLIRKAAFDQDVLQMLSPIDYLAMYPEQQVSQPPMSSWGAGGYAGVWLDESSDWVYIIKTGTMVDYAVRRTREHLLRFTRLYDQIKGNQLDERWLGQVEARDNLFPEIDYRVYRS